MNVPVILHPSFRKQNLTETWVFILGGQSNMLHQTNEVSSELYPDGTLQWGRSGGDNNTLVAAANPLQHTGYPFSGLGGIIQGGFVTRFANKIKERYPNTTLVFIPCAQGATSFAGNYWNKGDANYEDLIARTNLCLSENPDFKLKGFLWHQGESDAGQDNVNYESDYKTFIADWRTDVVEANEKTSFIGGGLVSTFIDDEGFNWVTNDIIKNIPNSVLYSGFADSESPTVLPGYNNAHFSLVGSLSFGDRYYQAYLDSRENSSVPIPDPDELVFTTTNLVKSQNIYVKVSGETVFTTGLGVTTTPVSGAFSFEVDVDNTDTGNLFIGVSTNGTLRSFNTAPAWEFATYINGGTGSLRQYRDGVNSASSPPQTVIYSEGDVLRIERDISGNITLHYNNTQCGSYSYLITDDLYLHFSSYTNNDKVRNPRLV